MLKGTSRSTITASLQEESTQSHGEKQEECSNEDRIGVASSLTRKAEQVRSETKRATANR